MQQVARGAEECAAYALLWRCSATRHEPYRGKASWHPLPAASGAALFHECGSGVSARSVERRWRCGSRLGRMSDACLLWVGLHRHAAEGAHSKPLSGGATALLWSAWAMLGAGGQRAGNLAPPRCTGVGATTSFTLCRRTLWPPATNRARFSDPLLWPKRAQTKNERRFHSFYIVENPQVDAEAAGDHHRPLH